MPALRSALDDGDELGVHAHNLRWSPDAGRWISDWSADFTEDVVRCALDAYESTVGSPCRIYRHGDRFTSPSITRSLLESSVVVDLTPEPGLPTLTTLLPDELATGGAIPHIDPALSRPYQPDPERVDLPVVPDGRLTAVPLTTVPVPNGRHEVLWLTTPPPEFRRRLRIRLLDPHLEHLAFVLRSDMVLQPGSVDAITDNLAHLRAQVPDLEWVPATDFVGTARHPHEFRADAAGALAAQAEAVLDALAGLATPPPALPAVVAARASDQLSASQARLREVEGSLTWRLHDRLVLLRRRVRQLVGRPRS